MMTNKNAKIAYTLIGLGFLIRLAYIRFHPIGSALYSDMRNYVALADLIKLGDWRPTHFFQPIGFPYLIVALKSLTFHWTHWLEAIHLVTSTLTLWIFWKIIKESWGEKTALISLAIASVHLPWLTFTGLALAENLFIFLLSVLAWASLKLVRTQKLSWAIIWALTFFVAFLTKGTHVFYGPLFLLSFYYFKRKESIKPALLIACIVGAGLLMHGLFTHSKIGKFQISASAGGLNFVEGKCPIKNNADSAGYSWLSPLYHQFDLHQLKRWDHPFTDSAFFMKEGFKCIKHTPLVLIQSLEGIPFLFIGNTLWPANQTKLANEMRFYELVFGIFAVVGLIIFARFFGLSENKEELWLVWILPVLSIFLCVYIFKSEIRFRIPFDVWIIPLAVKGWEQLRRARITSP